jgi:quercetin dioxygenase-like cupin family protein
MRRTARRFVTSGLARVHYAPWGKHSWLSEPALTDTTSLTLIRVSMPPGTGHQFHVHPELDEIIYVVDGVAEQWVDRDSRRLRKGEIAYIPKGVVHATYNRTRRPLTFLAILSPAASTGPAVIDCSNEEPWRTLRPPIVYRDVDPRTGRPASRQRNTRLNRRTRK